MDNFKYELKSKLNLMWNKGDFKVVVNYFVEEEQLKSNISVITGENGIKRIHFPTYNGVEKISEKDDVLLVPYQNGAILKNPVDNFLNTDKDVPFWMGRGGKKYENDYPAQYSYQCFAYYNKDKVGYYMGIEDGNAYIKTIGFHYNEEVNGMNVVFTNYPEGMDEVCYYELPYNYTFTFFKGDWQTAAKMYRKWAVNQKWYKPLKERNFSPELKNIDFVRINHEHYFLGTRDEEYIETCRMIKEKLSCNPAMHWYGWNKAPKHGDWYPEMADYSNKEWLENLHSINDRLTKMGVKKIPYVNVHLWDNHLESFEKENAIDTLVIPEGREIVDEPWCPERNLFAVCHATPKMKNKAFRLFERIVNKDGFDGIYIDQVGSFNATLCFNKEHGHPVGGGSWWSDEYHKMIDPLRKVMPKEKFLTTESCCETYHDLFDMLLTLDPYGNQFGAIGGSNNADAVPLLAMIYNDSVLSYGSICRFYNSDAKFEFNSVRCLFFGSIPTAEGMELKEITENAEFKWDVLKKVVDFYKENREVFMYGTMEEYNTYFDNSFTIEFKESNDKNCAGVVSVIYNYDNKDNVFVYNFLNEDKEIEVRGKNILAKAKQFTKVQL